MNTTAIAESPDPLRQAEERLRSPLTMTFDVSGSDRGIDALSICARVLAPLTETERAAAMAYLATRFGGVEP